jgi:anti-repressor protein
MSHDLIPVINRQVGEDAVQTVNARDLHAFLDVGKMFAHWIKDKIEQYGFVENRDYGVFAEFGNNPLGGRPSAEYALTLDMAKELAMVQNNEKGRQVRLYFIECERRAKTVVAANPNLIDITNLAQVLGTVGIYAQKLMALEAKVQEQAPKLEAFKEISEAEGEFSITETAKILQMKRPRSLFVLLQREGWIFRSQRHGGWIGFQTKVAAGMLKHHVIRFNRADGSVRTIEQVLVTPKGLTTLAEMLARADIAGRPLVQKLQSSISNPLH